jgi:hypothetical protein
MSNVVAVLALESQEGEMGEEWRGRETTCVYVYMYVCVHVKYVPP